MSTIQVRPHPDLDTTAWSLLIHPASGGLLDAAKSVPDDGRPWLYDGFTCRMLTDGAILRADDPLFALRAAAAKTAADGAKRADAPAPAAPSILTSAPAPAAKASATPAPAPGSTPTN